MLHRLSEQTTDASEPGFASKLIRYALDLGGEDGILPVDQRFDKCPHLVHSEMVSGGAGRSQFLVESLSTILLLDAKNKKRRKFYLEMLHQAGPQFQACALALENDLPRLQKLARAHRLKPTGLTTLYWKGQDLLAQTFWHDWWRNFRARLRPPSQAPWMRDYWTGELCQPVETHPRIGGLSTVGGMTVGDSLVSFEPASFESYGLSRAHNAAMSELSARKLADSLIYLCDSKLHYANSKIAYWYTHKQPDDPLGYLLEPHRTEFNPRLQAPGNYRILNLSGAHGRVMLRHWEEGPIDQLRAHVAKWHESIRITPLEYEEDSPLGLPELLESLYPAEKVPDNLAAPLLRAALQGQPLPAQCQQRAVHACRSDLQKGRPLSRARMGLIKASLGAVHTRVRPGHPDRTYQAGRLFALLQRAHDQPLAETYRRCWLCPHTALQPWTSKLDRLGPWFRWQIADFGELPQGPMSQLQHATFLLGFYQQFAHHPGRDYVKEEAHGD